MKYLGIAFLTLLLSFGIPEYGSSSSGEVMLTAKLSDCSDTLSLFRFDGFGFRKLQTVQASESGAFEFRVQQSDPRFYYIGQNSSDILPIILGTEGQVMVSGSCRNIRENSSVQSAINTEYQELKSQMNEYKNKSALLVRKYQFSRNNEEQLKEVTAEMKALDDDKLKLLESARQHSSFFGHIVAINTYLSYQNHGENYDNEIEYFAKEYFQLTDFKEEVFNQLPWVYEAFKSYATTLSSIGLPAAEHKELIAASLQQLPAAKGAQQLAYGGVIAALQQKNHPNLVPFAEQYIDIFEEIAPEAVAEVKAMIDQMAQFMVGGTAPDFTQLTPEGEAKKLSDFRGKVLLVDFWASWCGPCRRENPNVVKMYNKYKAEGFEILGVSLDSDKNRWLKAIEKDGLTWPHVSDLKGWKNEVAQLYNVTSIPHTILLDKEGKIIARNLRGPSLEQKLEEIFK